MRISDWSSDVCSSDLNGVKTLKPYALAGCDAPAHWTHTSMPDAGWHALRDEALQPIDHAQPLAITAALCNMLANAAAADTVLAIEEAFAPWRLRKVGGSDELWRAQALNDSPRRPSTDDRLVGKRGGGTWRTR